MTDAPLTPDSVVHRIVMEIRWGDMDALGHVNNTIYFRYFEQARITWIESAGWPLVDDNKGPVIINAGCTFLKPLTYPGTIDVSVSCGSPGRTSFETYYYITPTGESEPIYARGSAKIVWMDHTTGRSVQLPDAVREYLLRRA